MKQNKIYIFVSIAFFIVYIFIIYSTYTENKSYLLQNTKENQIKLVTAYKEKFDERLYALKRIVETMGKNLIKKDRDKEFHSIKEILTNAMNSGNGFKSVYIAYPDNFTISGRPDWYYSKDYLATQRPWYKEAVEKKKTSITKPYYGSPGFENKKYISIVSPIYINNKLTAVISSDLEVDSVQQELAKLFPSKKGFAFLMTEKAKIIAQSNKLEIDFEDKNIEIFLASFAKEKSGESSFKINNKKYIFTYKTLDSSDVLFVSVLDENEIYKNLEYQLSMNFLAYIVLFVLGFGTILFMSFTQKELYKKHQLLGHFAKSPTWGVLLTDKDGNIIFINKVFEKIFGLKSKSLYGKFLDSILDKLESDNTKQILSFQNIQKNLYKMKSYSIEKDEKIYRIQITPLLNKYQKELEGAIITVIDISHEKYLEKKEIEQEQILIQNSKMAALGEMISAISHQWRQPLSTLLMLISNAEEIIEKDNNAKASNYLASSRNTIEHMNETINAFRNFYKKDFGKGNFDLIDTINEIILITSPQLTMNEIELEFIYDRREEYSCNSYPSYIKQVLVNLIENSKDELSKILDTKPSFNASIKISLIKKENSYFISVEDNGRGIIIKNRDKIFEPFFTTKGETGTGTGLHLCKLLVENKMNGNFTLDNSSNPTKFMIEIRA